MKYQLRIQNTVTEEITYTNLVDTYSEVTNMYHSYLAQWECKSNKFTVDIVTETVKDNVSELQKIENESLVPYNPVYNNLVYIPLSEKWLDITSFVGQCLSDLYRGVSSSKSPDCLYFQYLVKKGFLNKELNGISPYTKIAILGAL